MFIMVGSFDVFFWLVMVEERRASGHVGYGVCDGRGGFLVLLGVCLEVLCLVPWSVLL